MVTLEKLKRGEQLGLTYDFNYYNSTERFGTVTMTDPEQYRVLEVLKTVTKTVKSLKCFIHNIILHGEFKSTTICLNGYFVISLSETKINVGDDFDALAFFWDAAGGGQTAYASDDTAYGDQWPDVSNMDQVIYAQALFAVRATYAGVCDIGTHNGTVYARNLGGDYLISPVV